MQLHLILLAVVASVLTTPHGAFTAEAADLTTFPEITSIDHTATTGNDQRAERRLRKRDTDGDASELNQDLQDEARTPQWLAKIVGNLDDVEKAVTKVSKEQSVTNMENRYDEMVDNMLDSLKVLGDRGDNPASLRKAVEENRVVIEKPEFFFPIYDAYWKKAQQLKLNT
ncbi:RXLR domain-containing protein [Phytophthora infestans]|uniref:RxLR effector protein n=1 Tax=Phytophthora infestans TaxID=4787 RepID=A0A833SIG9_PHYIN|nr:RXLR domain-containing protein [Phytophthora infestans]KAF4140232.1 RXLR effector domain-containing protein [Phytophthora infestans]KAI9983987.1 hypothetical protein PInf_005272 [Phytophthora infestans]